VSAPMEPFESQNVHDDDGQVLDSLFLETDAPPPLADAQEPIVVKAVIDAPPITRMFSIEQVIPVDWDVYQILPSDVKRKNLTIFVYSPTSVATDGIRFADERALARNGGKVLHNGTIDLSGHTGPLYILPTGPAGVASAPVAIQVWSVTA